MWARERANKHVLMLRAVMAADPLTHAGLCTDAGAGQLFYSRGEGDAWALTADFLPPIQLVEVAITDRGRHRPCPPP